MAAENENGISLRQLVIELMVAPDRLDQRVDAFVHARGCPMRLTDGVPSSRTRIPDPTTGAVPRAPYRQSGPGYFERTDGSSRTQILRKLIGGLGSPCACSLIGAVSYFL